MSNNSVKPLELVVSAIHSLRETKGSTPLSILRYLSGKYNVDTEMLKPYVKTGLKRGVSFGLLTQKSGLYRLNEVLSAPMDQSTSAQEETPKSKFPKAGGILKKRKFNQNPGKKRRRSLRPGTCQLHRNKKKMKKCGDRRKKTRLSSRRQIHERRRKQRQQKARGKKRMRKKCEKSRKVKKPSNHQLHLETEQQISEKEVEGKKDNPKM